MDDILASIRRILDEEGTRAAAPLAEPFSDPVPPDPRLPEARLPEARLPEADPLDAHPPGGPPDILELSSSMMLPEPDAMMPGPIPVPAAMFPSNPVALPLPERPFVPDPLPAVPVPAAPAAIALPAPSGAAAGLVAPAAAAAASASVGALMRTLATERGTAVTRGGPTIEDLVREEMRPILKEWLDTHLPPIVERLVRAEIERVVGRVG